MKDRKIIPNEFSKNRNDEANFNSGFPKIPVNRPSLSVLIRPVTSTINGNYSASKSTTNVDRPETITNSNVFKIPRKPPNRAIYIGALEMTGISKSEEHYVDQYADTVKTDNFPEFASPDSS